MTDIGYVACSLEARARNGPTIRIKTLFVQEPGEQGRCLWAINAVGHGHDGVYCPGGPAYEYPQGVITHTSPELHALRLAAEEVHES